MSSLSSDKRSRRIHTKMFAFPLSSQFSFIDSLCFSRQFSNIIELYHRDIKAPLAALEKMTPRQKYLESDDYQNFRSSLWVRPITFRILPRQLMQYDTGNYVRKRRCRTEYQEILASRYVLLLKLLRWRPLPLADSACFSGGR